MQISQHPHAREAAAAIRLASASFPVVLVTGPRQVGKTTLLRMLGAEEPVPRAYVTLDDPIMRDLAQNDPALFLQSFPSPVLIDEAQYAPQLFSHLKMRADQGGAPGGIWLTGSQQFALMRGVSESLAGRVALVQLSGLSLRERVWKPGDDYPGGPFLPTQEALAQRASGARTLPMPALFEEIWLGTFPGLVLGNDPRARRDLFFSSYIQTYLQRDLRDLARVGDESAFLRFLKSCAARTGQLLNMHELARDVGVAPNTAKAWLSILETSCILHLLQPWHTSASQRIIKTPKMYFLDTGLAAYLADWGTPEALATGAASGAFLETFVVGEILKSWHHRGLTPPAYFYRDKENNEADLLLIRDQTAHAVEIKKSAAPKAADLRLLPGLAKAHLAQGPSAVVCLCGQAVPLSESVMAVPVGMI